MDQDQDISHSHLSLVLNFNFNDDHFIITSYHHILLSVLGSMVSSASTPHHIFSTLQWKTLGTGHGMAMGALHLRMVQR